EQQPISAAIGSALCSASHSLLALTVGGLFGQLGAESVKGRGRSGIICFRSVSASVGDRGSDGDGDGDEDGDGNDILELQLLLPIEVTLNVDRSTVPKPSVCSTCPLGWPEVDFHWRNDRDAWNKQCKTCIEARVAASKATAITPESATCNKCGITKAAAMFYKTPIGNLHGQCRKCAYDHDSKRNANDPTHKERQKAIKKVWRERNPEMVLENQKKHIDLARTDPDRKLKDVARHAKDRGIAFPSDKATHDKFRVMFTNNCYYCNYKVESGGWLNGLDRIDNAIGYDVMDNDRIDSDGHYTPENTCACSECNFIKIDLPLEEFKRQVGYIARHTASWVIPDMSDVPK
ncbi:hypothetical protein B484DRAFT_392157, partial [Ochromonadaceae sp. CCMP2298]